MPWLVIRNDEKKCSKEAFAKYYYGFVVMCPSARKRIQKGTSVYEYVSVRDCSFRSRNITHGVFVTINSQIKKIVSGNYYSLNPNEVSVESQVEQIENDNENAELIVIKSRDDMSDTEAVFYCIRNAFAHGAFEIKGSGAKQLFLFESRRGDVLQGRIRLLKSNVDRILSISKMTREEILKLRLKQR